MPPLPPVPGVIKVQLFWTIHSYGGANVLHFSYTGGPPDHSSCAEIASTISSGFNSTLTASLGTDVALLAVVVTDLSSDTGASGQDLTEHAGHISSPVPGNQMATCTKWPVALRYRGGHPKTFWPPLPTSTMADPSNWGDAAVSNWNSLVDDFIAVCVAASGGSTSVVDHVAVSYFSGHAMRPTPLVLTLGSAQTNRRISSQRRRRNQPVMV